MYKSKAKGHGGCGCSGNWHGHSSSNIYAAGSCSAGGSSSADKCNALGPFVAVDAACIQPTPPTPVTGGSIIPFSSGIVPAVLASAALGIVGTSSLVGFGTSIPSIEILNNTIDLGGALPSEAFTVPRTGNITAISATFSVTVDFALLGTSVIRAQIFQAPAGSNTFTGTNAVVDLAPALTAPLSVGTLVSGSANVTPPVPVAVGDRLLMVFSVVSTSGIALANVVTGNASAGITIA